VANRAKRQAHAADPVADLNRRYIGRTREEAWELFVEDARQAAAAGYFPITEHWTGATDLTVDYRVLQSQQVPHQPAWAATAPRVATPTGGSRSKGSPGGWFWSRTGWGAVLVALIFGHIFGLALVLSAPWDVVPPTTGILPSPSSTMAPTIPADATPEPSAGPTAHASETLAPDVAQSPALHATPKATKGPTATRETTVPTSVTIRDATGDVRDLETGKRTKAPRYVDVKKLTVEADGDALSIRFDLAGAAPGSLDPLYTIVGYYVWVDTDADREVDYVIDVSSTEGWMTNVFDVGESFSYQTGSGYVDGDLVLTRVPLTRLGSPTRLAVQGSGQYEDYPDPVGDPFTSTTAEDLVPNDRDDWVTLSTR